MAAKMVLMMMVTVAVVVFSLATMPSPSAATRFVDEPTGKNDESNWCESCTVCTRSLPPYCFCSDIALCPKCVCSITLGPDRRQECETVAHKFKRYCLVHGTTAERTLASLI